MRQLVFAAGILIAVAIGPVPAVADNEIAATFTVDSISDDPDVDSADYLCRTALGGCTLRAAIQQANASPGADLITFTIQGDGPHTIRPTSPMPAIAEAVTIDGYTQPGSTPDSDALNLQIDAVVKIELDGSAAGSAANGLTIDGPDESYTAIRADVSGLAINRFSNNGIEFRDAGGQLEGNYIGTDVSGSADLGNGGSGIVHVRAAAVIRRNLISGNEGFGLHAEHIDDVPGGDNLIGTNADGTASIGNKSGGVLLVEVGDFPLHDNVISGNFGPGVTLVDSGEVYMSRNSIGTQVDGASPLGNAGSGIVVAGPALDVNIGTSGPNAIAYNEGDGIEIADTAHLIHFGENSIYSNGGLGIDLGGDGVTRNDHLDQDSGPNGLQNFPEITSVRVSSGETTIRGWLNSQPSPSPSLAVHTIDFYLNSACDESRYGEGETLLGSTEISTNNQGRARFEVTLPFAVPAGQYLSATADQWDRGTSEFSRCRVVH